MRAINLSSKLRPSVCRSVTEMVFTSSQKVIKPFCFTPFIFLAWRRMSCLRQKVNGGGKIRLIRGESVVSYPADLPGTQSPKLTTVDDLFQWGPRASAMDRRRTQICANKNRIEAILTIPPENINQIVLLEYFASADDVHIKYFYRRQPPACLRS